MNDQNNPPLGVAVDRDVRPHATDYTGKPIAATCVNCNGLYDDSDGPEYGPPSYRCNLKPHMENLRGFPFTTPQRCFELHWAHTVDWEEETKHLGFVGPNVAIKRLP